MDLANTEMKDPFRRLIGSEVWLLLSRLDNFLAGRGIESCLVGGWVRDALLGRDTADIDIAVAVDALEVAPEVAEAFGGRYVPLDMENRVARVVLLDRDAAAPKAPLHLDFSTFEGSIEQDLARRDFTINAMAVSLSQFRPGVSTIQIIDPFDGRGDLSRGIIRVVSETVFAADAARLLRAMRLAAELGFNIDDKTEALIRQNARLLSGVAGERIREELLRLLACPPSPEDYGRRAVSDTGQFFKYLDELGLLTAIFPELAETKGVAQPKEHHWDVFEHLLRTVTAVDFLLRQGTWEYAGEEVLAAVPWSGTLAEHFAREVGSGSTRRVLLKLAALLHDINKPQTRTIEAGGRIRFLGHAQAGAATVMTILERLRFSSKEVKLVETEILYHLRPTQMSQAGLPTNRAIYRYFRDASETGIDILFLSLADHLASRGPELNLAGWQEHARLVEYVINKRFEEEKTITPPKLIDGYDIINTLRTPPGREVGELLEAVREAQASGEVTTREEALSFIERLKKKNA
ncbi:MAG: CCA tRNA nucleotidyltransferase [Chloroflexi bacterium]|nr:CCA tRNA nucleotidyltransferase [Chloroflexota bacterium]